MIQITFVGLGVHDHAAALVETTDDAALELFWSLNFELHHRLKNHWLGLLVSLTEAHERRGLERDFRRVDGV